ncbi:MAG: YhbY family RNA-binding protein [Syntrophaceae bacterium]|nr:YhbY family RNA-binding protein [Syntrophaceae bacterium]
MTELKGFQKTYLRGLAHGLKPIVQIGKEGLLPGVIKAVSEGLVCHELIKVKFINFKETEQKKALSAELAARTGTAAVGMIGHTLILYRQQDDPDKRRIKLPVRQLGNR